MKIPYRTFIINLEKDTDRMAYMHRQMHSLDMSYERQDAIYGKEHDFSGEYIEANAVRKGGHALLLGELGCAVSHKRVYEKMIAEDIPYALVLEDDVALPTNFKQIVERELGRKNVRWEYLLFDYREPGLPFILSWFDSVFVNFRKKRRGLVRSMFFILYSIAKGFYIIPMSLFEGARNSLRIWFPGPVAFYRPVYFAGAYLVSRAGAEKLLSLADPILYTADKLPNQARIQKGLRFYAYAPLSVFQRKEVFGSSILGLRGDEL